MTTTIDYAQRDISIILEHEGGMTYASIGRKHGISGCRVKQIVCIAKMKKEREERNDPMDGLTVRASNICNNAGLKNKDQVRDAFIQGKFGPRQRDSYRNCGRHTFKEIAAWLGLPEPQKGKRMCPHCGGEL